MLALYSVGLLKYLEMEMQNTHSVEVTRPSCIIHWSGCSDSLCDNLISPRDLPSWSALKEAAVRRNFEPLLSISSEHTEAHLIPSGVYYHRQCRQQFTLRLPPTPTVETSSVSTVETARRNPKRVVPQSKSRILDPICIFCRKVKCLPKTSSKEHLMQCVEDRAEMRIREYAQITHNEYLLGITGCHELVAVEAKYHRSCYQKCIRVTDEHGKQCVDVTAEVQTDEPTAKAFQFITNYFERMVFGVKNIVALAEIANVYVAKAVGQGFELLENVEIS